MINEKKKRKIFGIIGALITLIIPFFILQSSGFDQIESAQSYCPFKMATGLPCPGCGITKSLAFLYDSNLAKSTHYHLFGPVVFLFCVMAIIVLIFELVTEKEYFQRILFSNKLAIFLGLSLAVYHLSRTIMFISSHSIDEILKESIWL